jgi:isopropylmalate/homocitrate/citramalate synthase
MDTAVITEIAGYYENEICYKIPPMTPFVGEKFNMTSAGIHADGLMKNEEIYNIFNTEKILNRPCKVAVNNTSGLAGIAHWVNQNAIRPGEKHFDKKHPLIHNMKEWVDTQYENGRVTTIADHELELVFAKEAQKLGL